MAELPGGTKMDARALANFHANVQRVADGVKAGLFAPAVEAACRLVVNESRSRSRPLAWNDQTGNLRSSISFQVEGHVGPKPVGAIDGSGQTYNEIEYRSGESTGTHGVVFAPPDYAVHVEMKASRSVLIEPLATVKDALLHEMGAEAAAQWTKFVGLQGLRRVL